MEDLEELVSLCVLLIQTVQQRGGAVIKARKLSSAMSAAKAICDHLRDWWFGIPDVRDSTTPTTPPLPCLPLQGQFVSMGVLSDGNTYGIPEGLIYSFPVRINSSGSWEFVQGLSVSDFAREKMDATAKELSEERDIAKEFLSA